MNTAELLGFDEFIPAFATLNRSSNLLSGANYASGAAGILRLTGKHMVIFILYSVYILIIWSSTQAYILLYVQII